MKRIALLLTILFSTSASAWVWIDTAGTASTCDDNVYPKRPNNVAKENRVPLKDNQAIADAWQGMIAECRDGGVSPSPAPTPAPTPLPKPTPTPLPPPTPLPSPTPLPPHNMGNMPMVDVSKYMTPSMGYADKRIKDATYPYGTFSSTGGDFRISCGPSHMNNDDSIVYPNQEGAAHSHTYFGNTGANYLSTPESLMTTGNSTCKGGIANRSAYWVPSLIDTTNGAPIKPSEIIVYYKGGDVKPPNGLVMIAGDHNATPSNQQSLSVIDFQCNPQIDGYQSWLNRKNHIVPCSGDMVATVKFPTCWDGVNLDSPDHKSHLSYSNGSCPAGYKEISNIEFAIHYPVSDTSNLRFANDNYVGGEGGYGFHGDYMFAWDDEVLDTWHKNCHDRVLDCHANLLGNGKELY